MCWNFDRILARTERVVDPASPAILQGERCVTWGQFKARTDRLASALLRHGARPGDKVAHYLRNGPEYMETIAACFKADLVHVNVNYRYTEDELYYLFDNSDAAVIVYDRDFHEQIAKLHGRLEKVVLFVETGDGARQNDFAVAYEDLLSAEIPAASPAPAGQALLFIYTGGTTGLPKGVIWRHEDLWRALGGGAAAQGAPRPNNIDEFEAALRAGQRGARVLICAPLMHGAGLMVALMQLLAGGTVVLAAGAHFDADATLATIDRHRPQILMIVGDAFARPLLRAIAACPGKYDLASLAVIISSGAVWSPQVKDQLIGFIGQVRCLDSLGSSEVVGLGMDMRAAGQEGAPARFRADAMTRVIADDGSELQPGSGAIGRIARAGPVPLGYYKDPEKTARTFVTLNGVRHAVPGDYATLEADGTIRLIGRGNLVINTGGEKVFVEEVEAALKAHPAVEDALVLGVPDPAWGQAVHAVVQANSAVSAAELLAHLSRGLARYKLPKRIVFVQKVPRGPNGKANYEAARDELRRKEEVLF